MSYFSHILAKCSKRRFEDTESEEDLLPNWPQPRAELPPLSSQHSSSSTFPPPVEILPQVTVEGAIQAAGNAERLARGAKADIEEVENDVRNMVIAGNIEKHKRQEEEIRRRDWFPCVQCCVSVMIL
jgi:hypothetical protein